MQTFLPHPSFTHSVAVLDRARLGKQRVECEQLLSSLRMSAGTRSPVDAEVAERRVGWINHPALLMWKGYESALGLYFKLCVLEWKARGYASTMETPYQDDFTPAPLYHWGYAMKPVSEIKMPPWLGDQRVHASHRANLLRKNPEWYGALGWTEEPAEEYYWPVRRD